MNEKTLTMAEYDVLNTLNQHSLLSAERFDSYAVEMLGRKGFILESERQTTVSTKSSGPISKRMMLSITPEGKEALAEYMK
jgi:hypothetical protein